MSIFNSQSLKAKLSKLDQVEKSNQLKLKKIQDVSNIKIDRDQYLKYKQILFNHSNPKSLKQQQQQQPAKVTTQATQTQTNDEKENNNLMNLSKPIPLLETEPSEKNLLVEKSQPQHQYQSEYRKNVYEFPKQMVHKISQESESEEVSCQTENDLMTENSGYFKGSNTIHNNVIIMEEMNPNLSFSSCPMSDFKARPLKDSFGDYQNQYRGANERWSGQKLDKKEKKTRLIEYGGESVEVSETDSEETQQEKEEKNKRLQEEYNMYKKTILYNKKKDIKEKIPTESEESSRGEEQDSVQLEFRLLLEQRKALESDISQLKKIQDEASKSLPKKMIGQKQISPRSPRFTLNEQQQQQPVSSSREFFEGIEERLSEIATLNNYDSARKFGSGRKENRREEQNFSLNDEREESEEFDREENIKTRRMKEDGWKVSQEFWDTRRRFINDDMNGHEEEEESGEISEDRFYPKDSDNYRRQQGDGIERKSRIRDLIDQVGASIEEIRNKRGLVEMKRNHMEDEHSLSKRTLYMVGSGSKDLVPISEEVSEEM